ncbi:MAG TPA: L,D-transpeptidase/peptidoglycan binding protein [Solirubrobacterales bacterium]
MGRKTQIAIVIGVAVLALGAVGAFAYDSSQDSQIADGVTIGGVDVGGMNEDEAKLAVQKELLAPLRHSLEVGYDGERWALDGKSLEVHADLDGAVEAALDASRDGGLPGRVVRYVTGGSVDENVPAGIVYSRSAVNRFVRHVAAEVNREPQNADVEPTGSSLEVTPAKYGRKLRDNLLTRELNAAVLNASADHTIAARTHTVKPEVTGSEVAAEYPSYLTLDRATFTLRLWEHLKLAKTYTVAVGQEGLETPEGLYDIQEKEENPSWHVPNSAWAGSLAGQVIPPGPEDPIKARWMGIFEGAGIHGTEETWSLGSAASHGCVRMSIPDVEELYDRVEVGTPIYIG